VTSKKKLYYYVTKRLVEFGTTTNKGLSSKTRFNSVEMAQFCQKLQKTAIVILKYKHSAAVIP